MISILNRLTTGVRIDFEHIVITANLRVMDYFNVINYIKSLKTAEIFERVGATKNGHWIVK